MSTVLKQTPNKTVVVAKAISNLKDELELTNQTVGEIIGTDASTISRIVKKRDMKENKTLELALLLIRVYRSLYAMVGGSPKAMIHWLNTPNLDFDGRSPLEKMKSVIGLVEVVEYLDAMRGHA